ncbi:MAG: chromosome partitioning protein ParB, partial [Proteobacteria bacterium]|nr:chromosome partitioning protein ParB [Pseudomonadota bacterium]
EKAAESVGKSRSHVANTLRLLQLPAAVQDHVLFGRLTAGHARAILASAYPEVLAQTIVDKGLSVRDAEALAKKGADAAPGGGKASGPRRSKDTDTAALEVDLEDVLGMKVDIVDRGGAGEVKIRYATLEQLDEICRRLTRA